MRTTESSKPVAGRAAGRRFFGRERELAELRAGLADSLSTRGRLLLVVGDPGIGKTRLCTELSQYAAERGARVFWGRCWEAGGAPAYWPWIQILRTCLRSQDSPAVESRLGLGASSIAELVPEIGKQLPPRSGDAPAASYEHARFYLFDSVTAFFKALAATQPLVLIVDDLQAADEASLLLLRYLAQEIQQSPIFLLGAYRESELRGRPALAEVLRHLTRSATRIPLSGLREEDVKSLVELRLGSAVSSALAAEVHRATEGNPFFIDEIIRVLGAEGRLAAGKGDFLRIPEEIHDTIRRRFQALSAGCREMLSVASVMGRDFNVALLARVSGGSIAEAIERLGEAVQAGAILPVAEVAGRYAFAHALLRETFYADLPNQRRQEIHGQAGEALEQLHGGDIEPHYAVIAHHFYQAAASASARPAIRYAMLAGERASRLLAFEEATIQFRRALEVLTLETSPSGIEHYEVLCALGEAERKAGETDAARASFSQAADLARAAGAREVFARAALAYGGGLGGMGYMDRANEAHVALLEEAIDWLGAEDSVLRAHCLARLAAELYYTDFLERRRVLSEQAVAMAVRTGDVGAQMAALHSRHWSLWGPDSDPQEQRRAAIEILRLAERSADKEMSFRGHQLRMSVELVLGDLAAVGREIDACAALAAELRQPMYLWQVAVFRAMRALLSGRAGEAERLSQEALALGQRGYEMPAQSFFAAQTANLCWMRGRLATIEPIVVSFVAQYPRVAAWRAGLAYLYSELGRTADARAEFEMLAREDFAAIPRDGTWLDTIYILALVCAFLQDGGRAATLYRLLSPYADRNATITGGVVCFGPVAVAIGALATTLGRWDEAERFFLLAAERAAAMSAPPYAMLAQLHRAMLRLARRQRGDVEEARTLAERVREDAAKMGLDGVVAKADRLLGSIQALAGAPAADSVPAGAAAGQGEVFRLEQDSWTIVYESKSFRLRDAKGLHYICRLLHHPQQKFHVADLASGKEVGQASSTADRVADIEADERLRKAVANSIRYAIARIEKESPALGLHLTNALRTGMLCCYVPDRPPSWRF